MQRLTSQVQELQERENCVNDSGELQETESNYSGIFTRSQSTGSHFKSSFYAKPRQKHVV